MKTEKAVIGLRIDAELKKRAESVASDEGRTLSSLVIWALKQYIEKTKK